MPSQAKMSRSILDTDLYKLTMQNAVRICYPDAKVTYRFKNRSASMRSNAEAFAYIQDAIKAMDNMRLTPEEKGWLTMTCPYFPKEYLDFLSTFELDSSKQVRLKWEDDGTGFGDLDIEIEGLWKEVILYEVPILSILSEAYFRFVDKHWDYVGQRLAAKEKGMELLREGIVFSEFGTRRRRSYHGHKIVMQGLIDARNHLTGDGTLRGKLTGTSNVHLAMLFNVNPVGTIAHEWIMGIAAMEGYEGSNALAMKTWEKVYPGGALRVALTDTFSTKPFFDDMRANPDLPKTWNGLRQDSGDPFEFIHVAIGMYKELGIDPSTKNIVFSDGLHVDKAVKLAAAAKQAGIGCSMGVGTFFTNDYRYKESPDPDNSEGEGDVAEGPVSKPMNIVIKLYKINGIPCVKISDEMNKVMGEKDAVEMVRQRFGLDKGQVLAGQPQIVQAT